MKLELKPRGTAAAGTIEWDPATGDMAFDSKPFERDFSYILMLAEDTGTINTWPHPSIIEAKDPTHNMTEFAALCGTLWEVPPELKKYYPKIIDNTPPGAIN